MLNDRIQKAIAGRAFTIVELVLVIALIAALAAITIGVGASMADSGRKRATEGVIQVLDQALDEYITRTGSMPTAMVRIESSDLNAEVVGLVGAGNAAYYPAIDGRFNLIIPDSDPVRNYEVNSVGLFLNSIKSGVDVDGLMKLIDSKFVKNFDVPGDLQPGMLTVFDAWGNPIRYVHPKFDGIIENGRRAAEDSGQFLDVININTGFFTAEHLPLNLTQVPILEVRRNKILASDRVNVPEIETDSDGGVCVGQRPYFYSAGPDGDPATIEDNVYTTKPQFVDPL